MSWTLAGFLDPPALAGPALAAALAVGTLRHVYAGGRTLNDHFVAAVVAGCIAVYPTLWIGALGAGWRGWPLGLLGAALLAGAVAEYGLFHVLDRRRDPGPLLHLARLSQPAYAFSLWTGLLLLLRAPWLLLRGAPAAALAWPGPWLLLPLALALWGSAWTWLQAWRVRRWRVAGAPRIVHLSDLHAGPCTPAAEIDALVARAEALRPDLVLITGDLVMPFSEAPEAHRFLVEALGRIRAPVLACPGNHDQPVTELLGRELAAVGARWLVDDRAVVEVGGRRVEVVGLDFSWREPAARARAALARLDAAIPDGPAPDLRVLLVHDPRAFDGVPDGRFDLVLAGHTHGGQVGTDMFGVPGSLLGLLGVADQGCFARGGARLFVHRGTWHVGLPPRMGIASEILLFADDPALPEAPCRRRAAPQPRSTP